METQAFTCINCRVAFQSAEAQREHYRSDWHRYNLKRKVAALPPVSAEGFRDRVVAQQSEITTAQATAAAEHQCATCNKKFNSSSTLETHVSSKKHKDRVLAAEQLAEDVASGKVAAKEEPAMDATPDEAVDEHLELSDCLFCPHRSETLESNLEHMTGVHSFFIPEIEYLANLPGLIAYLQEKVADFHLCLTCNGRGRSFYTLKGVRAHMLEKGHVFMDDSEEGEMERHEYYDYSKASGDWEDVEDGAAAGSGSGALVAMGDNELAVTESWELVLPSGKTAVHRDMLMYTKQRFRPEDTRDSVNIQRMMDQ